MTASAVADTMRLRARGWGERNQFQTMSGDRPTATRVCGALVLLLGVLAADCPAQNKSRDAGQLAQPPAEGFEVLLRGPLHEGFAQPVVLEPVDPLVVLKRPPRAPHELPPLLRPASAATIWLPGYWGWDDREQDFLWVSGVWRLPPPGMRWVPGHWSARGEGFAWTPGFWFPVQRTHLHYLASPPPPRATKPEQPAQDADKFYVPGYWAPTSEDYTWRRGHWADVHEGWVWMPTRHMPTPAGTVLAPGYWDYRLARRGVPFAPVLTTDATAQRGALIPRTAIDLSKLSEFLFIWPAYGHYCFGDYFGGAARKLGIVPWFTASADPLYGDEHWHRSRVQPNWQETLAERFERRRANAKLRPAMRSSDAADAEHASGFAVALKDWSRAPDAPLPLTAISPEGRASAARAAESMALLGVTRAKFELETGGGPGDGPRLLALPAQVASPSAERGVPRVGTTGEYLPGVGGREVPGYGRRALPGMTGRTVPGVDSVAPGIVAPGVLPGADTRTLPGVQQPPAQPPRRP